MFKPSINQSSPESFYRGIENTTAGNIDNGGSLERFSYGEGDLNIELLAKVKKLLPNTQIKEFKQKV